ncbi:unnamed protein product [Staurois parvus]|uniref:Uncharacterized protein n=1 Tax=Staurois parvus TaxID=386267 RepID=A0ABN9ABR8_9NEOB|nr:unnamed protein product [Staurois parvus]
MYKVTPHDMSYWKKGSIKEVRINQPFYTRQRINPLGSILKYALLHIQTDLLLWV